MQVITADNLTAVINIVTWFLLVTSALAVLTRLGTKYYVQHRLALDDAAICVSLLFCILQSVCVSIAGAHGYGRSISALSHDQLDAVLKATYAGNMLYIASLFFSKLSVVAFVHLIGVTDRKILAALVAGLAVWGAIAELAVAFECQFPHPWDDIHQRCFNLVAWWTYFGVSNIITEVAVITYPIAIVAPVQMPIRKKLVIFSCFLVRIFVIIAIICALVYRNRDSADPTLDMWPVVVCVQVAQTASILTACVPQFKPFMRTLETSGLRLYRLRDQQAERSLTGVSDYCYQRSATSRHHDWHPLDQVAAHKTLVMAGRSSDADSHSSRVRIIRETSAWTGKEEQGEGAL